MGGASDLPHRSAIEWTLAAQAVAAAVLVPTGNLPRAQATPDPPPPFLVERCAVVGHSVPIPCAAMMQRGWVYVQPVPVGR